MHTHPRHRLNLLCCWETRRNQFLCSSYSTSLSTRQHQVYLLHVLPSHLLHRHKKLSFTKSTSVRPDNLGQASPDLQPEPDPATQVQPEQTVLLLPHPGPSSLHITAPMAGCLLLFPAKMWERKQKKKKEEEKAERWLEHLYPREAFMSKNSRAELNPG